MWTWSGMMWSRKRPLKVRMLSKATEPVARTVISTLHRTGVGVQPFEPGSVVVGARQSDSTPRTVSERLQLQVGPFPGVPLQLQAVDVTGGGRPLHDPVQDGSL